MAYKVVFEKDHSLSIEAEDLQKEDLIITSNDHVSLLLNSRNYNVELLKFDLESKTMTLLLNGKSVEVSIHDEVDQMVHALGMEIDTESVTGDILAPMPGKVLDIHISPGQEVHEGDPLLVLEAMKMENILKATGSGIVKELNVKSGDTVEKSQLLITIE
jgi:biotin carboxyl carrier protein